MKKKSSEFSAFLMTRVLMLLNLLCLQRPIRADLITAPQDTEALNDTLTFFNCSSNLRSSTIQWFHYGLGDHKNRQIVYGYDQFHGSYKNRFRIEGNDTAGELNLIIDRVSVKDAGKFECQDDKGRGASGYAQLTVLETKPLCQWKNEYLQEAGSSGERSTKNLLYLNCTVIFRGNTAPRIVWKTSGEAIAQDKTTTDISAARITSISILEVTHDNNGQSFQCQTNKSGTTPYSCTSGPVAIKENTDPFSTASVAILPLIVGLSVGAVLALVAVGIIIQCIKNGKRSPCTRRPGHPDASGETPDDSPGVDTAQRSYKETSKFWKERVAADKLMEDHRPKQKRQDAVKEEKGEKEMEPMKLVNGRENSLEIDKREDLLEDEETA